MDEELRAAQLKNFHLESHAVEGIPEPPPKIGTTNRVEIRYPWNGAPLSRSRWSSLVLSHTISLSLVDRLGEIIPSSSPNSRDSISTKINLSSKSHSCEVASRVNYHIDKSWSCKTVAFSLPLAIAVGGRSAEDGWQLTRVSHLLLGWCSMRSPTESTRVRGIVNWRWMWWSEWGGNRLIQFKRK